MTVKKDINKEVKKKSVSKKDSKKKTLVIVESPSKAKTIGKFLGSTYKIVASVGHIRDLPKSKLGIDIDADFEPNYINVRGKGPLIKELKSEAKKAKKILLATDPDREGEAISWHLAHILEIDEKEPCRIVFNEITKDAVKKAIKEPRVINQDLVDAQQARRVLDRIVGYSISPLLWRKVKKGLSAGRVQSVALKLISDREKEINLFEPKEFWNIGIKVRKETEFEAKLRTFKGRVLNVKNEEEADKILAALNDGNYKVSKIEEKERKRKPSPPYTTSSLQQDSSSKLNFGTRKTMQIAQQLYEGIDVKGKGTVGLVSYIRTDSTRISEEARSIAKKFIKDSFGEAYYGGYKYEGKKSAQDAHEAIRPSYVELDPESIKASLTADQYKLYKLIWNRYVASQMSSSIYKSVTIDIDNQEYSFRASGSTLIFDGYLKVYSSDKDRDVILPKLDNGENLSDSAEKITVNKEQKFTQPPAYFTEASLVKTLEELGIGRPSTYAPIVGTLIERRYVKKEKKNLRPTDLGSIVSEMMEEYFGDVVDTGFTADLESQLDKVGSDISDWKEILRNFYKTFEKDMKFADENIERIEREDEVTDIVCDKCGDHMVKKHGRFGEFLACKNYPECKNTMAIVNEIGVKCQSCGGEIVEKRSRRGKIFYGCNNYPECNVSYWTKPTGENCPKCNSPIVEKETKRFSGVVCSNEECDYKKKKEEN